MRYKYRERYKNGYFYVEEFDEDKQKYVVLYTTYDIMDAHMWLKNHRMKLITVEILGEAEFG